MIGWDMPYEAEQPVIFAHRGGSVSEDLFVALAIIRFDFWNNRKKQFV